MINYREVGSIWNILFNLYIYGAGMKGVEKDNKIDMAIGIYTIDAFILMNYVLYSLVENVDLVVEVAIIICMAWFLYSIRLLNLYAEMKYSANYMFNYVLCNIICLMSYKFLPIQERFIIVFLVSVEGFARTFLIEIWRLIKISKEEENETNKGV